MDEAGRHKYVLGVQQHGPLLHHETMLWSSAGISFCYVTRQGEEVVQASLNVIMTQLNNIILLFIYCVIFFSCLTHPQMHCTARSVGR